MTTTLFSFRKNKICTETRIQIYNVKIKIQITQVHVLNYICPGLNNDKHYCYMHQLYNRPLQLRFFFWIDMHN